MVLGRSEDIHRTIILLLQFLWTQRSTLMLKFFLISANNASRGVPGKMIQRIKVIIFNAIIYNEKENCK